MFSDKSRPRAFHPLTLLEGICYFLLLWEIPDSNLREKIFCFSSWSGKSMAVSTVAEARCRGSLHYSRLETDDTGKKSGLKLSSLTPSSAHHSQPGSGPSCSTIPKSIPPGRDNIQTLWVTSHFTAGHLKGFFFLFFEEEN